MRLYRLAASLKIVEEDEDEEPSPTDCDLRFCRSTPLLCSLRRLSLGVGGEGKADNFNEFNLVI